MDPVKSGAIFRARDGTPLRSPFPKQMLESPASASALSTVFRPQARRPDDFVAPSPFVYVLHSSVSYALCLFTDVVNVIFVFARAHSPQRPSHGSLHQSTPAARNGAIITPGSHSLDQRLDHLIMSSPVPKVLQHQLQSRGLDLVVSPSTPSATSNRRPMASFSVEPRRLPDHLLPNRTPNAAARPAVASPPAYQPAEGGQSFSWSSNPADLSGFTNGPAMRSPAQSMDSARRSMPPRFLPENQSSSTPSVSSSVSPHVAARSDWDRANGRGSHGTPSPAVMPTPAKPKGTPFTYRKANVETPMRQSAVDSTPNLGDVLTAYSQTRAGGSGSGTGTAVDVRARPSSTNSASAPFPDSELDLRQDVFQDVLVAETQLDPDEEVEQPVIDQLDQPEPSAVVNAGSILDSDQDADIDAPTGAAMDVVNASATDGAPLMSMAHSSVPQRNGSLVRESVFVQPQGDDRYPVETILTSERGTTFRKGGGSHATIVTLSFTPLMTLLHSPSQIPDSEAKSSGAAPSDSVMDDAEEEVRSPRSASGKRSGKATVTPVAASSKSVRSTGRARTASTPQKAESSSKQEVVNVDDSSDSELEARAEVRSSSAQLSSPARRSALKSTTPAAKAASSPSKATSSTPKTRTPAVTFDATPSSKNGGSSAAEAVPSHSRTRTTSPRDTKTPVKDTSAAASKAGLVTPTNQVLYDCS